MATRTAIVLPRKLFRADRAVPICEADGGKELGRKPSLCAAGAALMFLAVSGSAEAGGGNFMSGCEADVFSTAQQLGVAPSLYAPGTDGPNTMLPSGIRFA